MQERFTSEWPSVTLGSVVERMTNGSSLKQLPEPFENSLPITRIETIASEVVDFDRVRYVMPEKKDIDKFLLRKGDILLSHINSDKHLGKTALYEKDDPIIHGINLLLIRVKEGYDAKFLNYIFRYYRYTGKFIEVAQRAVNQSSINQKKLKAFHVPNIPLEEQQRIAAKLDVLFGQIEAMKASLEKIPQLLENFRQQVLTQAVTGKLTEEWRRALDANFTEWKEVKIADLVDKIEAGKNFRCLEKSVNEGEVGLVKISAVTWGEFNEKETKTVDQLDRVNPRYFIKKGDFLMSRANTIELVGASVIVSEIQHDVMISDKVWRVVFKDETYKTYINYFLKSRVGRVEIEARASGNQMSMRNLSQKKFLDIDLAIPSLEERTEIVCRVNSLFKKADAIEAHYMALKQDFNRLPQSILHKAFKGELVK